MNTNTEERAAEQRLRRHLKRRGYTLIKSRKQIVDYDNQGGYMVVDNRTGFAVGGARYDWNLDDVQEFVDGDLPYD